MRKNCSVGEDPSGRRPILVSSTPRCSGGTLAKKALASLGSSGKILVLAAGEAEKGKEGEDEDAKEGEEEEEEEEEAQEKDISAAMMKE